MHNRMETKLNPFSPKQRLTLSWWTMPQYRAYDAIICDGAVRSGKTVSMSIGFVSWAMTSFRDGTFAICGKTITALKRNVINPLLGYLGNLGFQCLEKSASITLTFPWQAFTTASIYSAERTKAPQR